MWRTALLLLVIGGMGSSTMISAADSAMLVSEFVYESAPFPSCHASTIVESTDGQLVAAWFGGTAEGKADVGVWMSRRVGKEWTPPVEVANGVINPGERWPCWNPVLFQPKEGLLMLFYKVGPSPSTWWGMVKTSADNGQTWSAGVRLPEGIIGPVKNKPIQLDDGVILAGSSTEGLNPPPVWQIHIERSTDRGLTWQRIKVPTTTDGPASIQPSLLQHADGRLQAVGRTRSGKLFSTVSHDRGLTWDPVSLLSLPNPNSGTDAVTLQDGRQVLIYNHTAKGRSPLNLAVSSDGIEWHAALVLESELGEYSYPAIIQTADGRIHATYTWKRQKIKHVLIDPARLTLRPITDGNWPE